MANFQQIESSRTKAQMTAELLAQNYRIPTDLAQRKFDSVASADDCCDDTAAAMSTAPLKERYQPN